MVYPMLKAKFRPFCSKTSLNAPITSLSNEAMEDPPIKHGYLCTPPQGKLLKRTWQKKYYALYKASNYGVERVEVFDNEDSFFQHSSSRKIIPLNDCVKVVQAPQKHQQNVFDVITKSQMYQFSADTTQELSEWLQAFQMVAFGSGQRRDLGPSTPPPSSSYSSGHSQTSSSSSVNAEEENQIYSSFNGPEVHVVRVVETEASLACGLQGAYLLVVSSIQLFLLEEGMSVNGKKYLFAWPYRHIRRYGRNKNTFTFEAGRKCTSGAGTFTFNTNDANAIFLSVQAYTRTLKREEEDAAMLTPSIIMNRTAQSWPSVEDVNLKSQNANNSVRQVSMPADVVSLGMSKSETKDNIFERVLSRGKVLPPFAKPPRKIKSSVSTNNEEKPASEPIRFELSHAARAKLSKSSSSTTIGITSQDQSEPTYAEPEVRSEAWKVFGMESDNFHKEKLPDVGPYDEDGGMYASIAVSPTSPSSVLPWSPSKKEVPKILTALKRPTDSGCYDHLSQFVQQSPQPTVISDGHIYTRLVSVSTTDTSQITSTTLSSSPERSVNENHQDGKPTNNSAAPVDSSFLQPDDSEDIKRFLQNDDVYTVVAKPFKKFNAKSEDV